MAQLGEALDPDLMAGPTSVQERGQTPRAFPWLADPCQRSAVLDSIMAYVGNLPVSQAAERMSAIEATGRRVDCGWARPGR